MQPTAASTSVTGHGIRGILLAVPSVITELDVTEAFRVVDLAGVLCNGIIGASIARQRRFDLVGLIILGTVSGLAGGVLRDVMLNVGQPVALTDPAYLGTALIGVAIALVFRVDGRRWRWPLTVIDALALGCWAATGTIKAQIVGLDLLPSLLLGVVTAVGGGMVRDLCVGQTPAVLGGNTLYATAAAAASGVILLTPVSARATWGMGVGILVGGGLTLLARRLGWSLPLADPDAGVHLSRAQLAQLIRRSERAGARKAGHVIPRRDASDER